MQRTGPRPPRPPPKQGARAPATVLVGARAAVSSKDAKRFRMPQEPQEASITINGVPLTIGQSMTLRVAVTQFHAELTHKYMRALGKIGPLYKARCEELLALLLKSEDP